MLRLLFTRRWLGALLGAVAFAVVCYHLGWWQYHRHEDKLARATAVETHYGATPVALPDYLSPGAGLRAGDAWLRVEVRGTYADDQLLVRNRPRGGTTGYEAVAPLRVDDGRVLLVDRGWVPPSQKGAADLPTAPPAPAGPVTVTGWLRPGEDSLHRTPAPGTLASINLPEAAEALHEELVGAYLIADHEVDARGTVTDDLLPLDPPDVSLGPHQAYAYQWWLGMSAGFVLIWLGIRRELRDAAVARGEAPVKPKKVRIWDEEDE